MSSRQIDRDKLRAEIHGLGHERILSMLDDAIALLSQAKILKLVQHYLDPAKLCPDRKQEKNLLADIKAFEKASLAGKYYQSFAVNSKNYLEKSSGTRSWIAEYHRLLDRCVAQATSGIATEISQSFDIIFGLLDYIDKGLADIIFFADEAGSWQVGVEWEKVLPAWFNVLSATAEPADYARRITALLKRHCDYKSANMLAVARRIATPAQRQALAEPLSWEAHPKPNGPSQ